MENAGKTALLQEGIKFKAMSVANVDAQWLEARRFSREEVAGWFNLPPHKLGALENAATRSNLEEQNLDYWNASLSRWATKWEQEAEEKLFSDLQKSRGIYQVRFDLSELLRGDMKTRFNAYAQGRQWGWLSVNEIRSREGMPPIGPDGDIYLTPVNMTDDPAGSTPAAGPAPAEPAEEDDTINDRVREAVTQRLGELWQVENDRLVNSTRHKTFLNRVGAFYHDFKDKAVEKLGPLLAIIDQSDVIDSVVDEYCAKSEAEIVAVGVSWHEDAWPEQVALTIETWQERRREMISKLMGDAKCPT
jgi:hypothetical protein